MTRPARPHSNSEIFSVLIASVLVIGCFFLFISIYIDDVHAHELPATSRELKLEQILSAPLPVTDHADPDSMLLEEKKSVTAADATLMGLVEVERDDPPGRTSLVKETVKSGSGTNTNNFAIDRFLPAIMARRFDGTVSEDRIFTPVRRQVITRGNSALKRIALTIDDGFSRDERLLDLLEENGVRCTVFLIGGRGIANARPDWLGRMDRMGFEICNHTFTHSTITKLPDAVFQKELRDTQRVISGVTKKMYPYFRPPGGMYDSRTLGIAAENGYLLVNWSNSTGDSVKGNSVERQVRFLLSNLKNGDIILSHFGAYNSREVIRRIIPEVRKRGYEFVTLSEVLEGM